MITKSRAAWHGRGMMSGTRRKGRKERDTNFHEKFALMAGGLFQSKPLSSFTLLNFVTILGYANFIRHPALGRASSGQLFRHDETGHRVAGKRRDILFHR